MTPRQLLKHLMLLPEDVMESFDIAVTEGCDENGNAEFFTLTSFCVTGDGTVDAAADGVLDEGSPVLIFGEVDPEVPIFSGGMLRCCHSTLLRHGIRQQPVGTVVNCAYCTAKMERKEDGWHAIIGES